MEQPLQPKTSPKDFFLHLLSMVTLYASAVSFSTVAFQIINLNIPDLLDQSSYGYTMMHVRALLRTGLSMLIVMLPVFIGTLYALKKSYQKDEAKRNLRVHKWLIYFTLFVAIVINLITLIFLVNHFLDGEVTLRFLLKTLTVFFVAGSTIAYYWFDLKKHS